MYRIQKELQDQSSPVNRSIVFKKKRDIQGEVLIQG
jgi:hypothetical protein